MYINISRKIGIFVSFLAYKRNRYMSGVICLNIKSDVNQIIQKICIKNEVKGKAL